MSARFQNRSFAEHILVWFLGSLVLLACDLALARSSNIGVRTPSPQIQAAHILPESELQTGIALTQQGHFSEAIPHLLAAKGRVGDEYAATFDLALCYVGTNQFNQAAVILEALKSSGHSTAAVNNLLAQAYIGATQPQKALAAFREAARQSPLDEKMYLLIADACMDHQWYEVGSEVLNIGLKNLPGSAKLHYERGVFSTLLDQPDQAKSDYEAAAKLARGTDISYMALGQKDLLEGNIRDAIEVTQRGIKAGNENYILLAIFGNSVALAGTGPGEPLFAEAESALEKSIAERPRYAPSQLALGELLLRAGRLGDAVAHLEEARQLMPTDPSIYSHLAVAYRRQGRADDAQQMLRILSRLNEQGLQKYKSDSPTKTGYVAAGRIPGKPE
jgi:tetratricopeptide (TPR) repeat protein